MLALNFSDGDVCDDYAEWCEETGRERRCARLAVSAAVLTACVAWGGRCVSAEFVPPSVGRAGAFGALRNILCVPTCSRRLGDIDIRLADMRCM